MKRLLLALALAFPLTLPAAKWDGTYPDMKVVTFVYNTSISGLAPMGDPPIWFTEFLLQALDPTVTAFRVTITYVDASGPHSETRVADIPESSPGQTICFFAVNETTITSASFTPLRDGMKQSISR